MESTYVRERLKELFDKNVAAGRSPNEAAADALKRLKREESLLQDVTAVFRVVDADVARAMLSTLPSPQLTSSFVAQLADEDGAVPVLNISPREHPDISDSGAGSQRCESSASEMTVPVRTVVALVSSDPSWQINGIFSAPTDPLRDRVTAVGSFGLRVATIGSFPVRVVFAPTPQIPDTATLPISAPCLATSAPEDAGMRLERWITVRAESDTFAYAAAVHALYDGFFNAPVDAEADEMQEVAVLRCLHMRFLV
jgi:hypothetical protein